SRNRGRRTRSHRLSPVFELSRAGRTGLHRATCRRPAGSLNGTIDAHLDGAHHSVWLRPDSPAASPRHARDERSGARQPNLPHSALETQRGLGHRSKRPVHGSWLPHRDRENARQSEPRLGLRTGRLAEGGAPTVAVSPAGPSPNIEVLARGARPGTSVRETGITLTISK